MESKEQIAYNSYKKASGILLIAVILIYGVGAFLTQGLDVDAFSSVALYHAGVASFLIHAMLTACLAFTLYVVLLAVDKRLALFAMLCRVCEAVLFALAAVFALVAIEIYEQSNMTNELQSDTQFAVAKFALQSSSQISSAALCFFGLGSTIYFYLFWKSKLIPSQFAMLGIIGSITLPIWAIANMFLSANEQLSPYLIVPITLAEILAGLWLLRQTGTVPD